MASLSFVKMQGAGNDFVVLDALAHPLPEDFDFAAAALVLCRRRFGVGGDGLLLLTEPEVAGATAGAAVRMRIWNPDGTEDMCGNGLRCVAALAQRRGHGPRAFVVQTLAGPRAVEVLSDGRVRAAMGEPRFELAKIPMAAPHDALPHDRAVEYQLPVGEVILPHVTSLSTGSTHTVIFGPHPGEEAFQRRSPLIENHPWFPERTSVLWTQVVDDDHLRLRIWERGVGETLACGTGACAAAVAAQITERCGERVCAWEVQVEFLEVEWRPAREMFLTGPAQVVCEGKTL